jgi:serine/threonine-protein kinase
VYALGAVLYELLTGRPPFSFGGQNAVAVATQRLVSDPRPPRSLNARIPVALQSVVMRALARDPAHRYMHAAEMAEALRVSVGETLAATHADTQVIPRRRTSRDSWRSAWSGVSAPRRAALVAVVVSILLAGVTLSRLGPAIWQNQLVAPRLVGYRLAELPAVLEQAGLAPGDVSVITRPVEQSYVGKVVDQQPQPGQRLESSAGLQVAVGVPRR